ncbi:MAG: hypothetical protein AB1898_17055 [Acidobacteriota bacterium]
MLIEKQIPETGKRELLAKVLGSRTFQGSESLKSFLRYVVERTIEDPDLQLKEFTIATEVFGRGTEFDPRVDSVVRVQAGRLRSKLQEYYASEGKRDPLVIDLPKGHYSATFRTSEALEGSEASEAVGESPLERPSDSAEGLQSERKAGSKVLLMQVGMLLLLAACVGLLTMWYLARRDAGQLRGALRDAASPGLAPEYQWFWRGFVSSQSPVLIVFSNTRFQGTAETGMRLLQPLSAAGANREAAALVITEHYTGIGEVMAVSSLSRLLSEIGHPFRVKRSLLLNWDDMKAENFIFVGSPAENLLLRDLPQKQDFVFGMVPGGSSPEHFGILNSSPRPDELPAYRATQEGPSRSEISEDFAVVSLLQGLQPNRRLMILAGITTYGTQAAAEFVTSPAGLRELHSKLSPVTGATAPAAIPPLQVLLRVKVNGRVPVQVTYVTHHILN